MTLWRCKKFQHFVYSDDVIEAAWQAGIGVHALIWVINNLLQLASFFASLRFQFGWDDPNIWKTRRDTLLGTLHSNRRAKYVTRVVQFGSEPLYDYALDPRELASQVRQAKANLSSLEIPVTISEMVYGYQVVCGYTLICAVIFIELAGSFFNPASGRGFHGRYECNRFY
jgi:hypothetical protein